jgi:hypothetical protein
MLRLSQPVAGDRHAMRTMYTIYWFLILGGIALWLSVGLVVD